MKCYIDKDKFFEIYNLFVKHTGNLLKVFTDPLWKSGSYSIQELIEITTYWYWVNKKIYLNLKNFDNIIINNYNLKFQYIYDNIKDIIKNESVIIKNILIYQLLDEKIYQVIIKYNDLYIDLNILYNKNVILNLLINNIYSNDTHYILDIKQ